MKHTVITFLILTVFIAFGRCQSNKENNNKKKAEITFEEITFDFGTISKGSDASHEFIFTNTGKIPLTLENVKSSCGCTVPSWTKEPIKKRKTGSIKVKYNSNIIGNFSKSVTVHSNAINSPVILRIKGKVVDQAAA
ncbi:MAG: DUF1573 domain-containing protein, partial [Bacteroidota bacterium]